VRDVADGVANQTGHAMKITNAELEAKLRDLQGATIVSLIAQTVPDMYKTANPYWGKVHKLSRVKGLIGVRYENSVNRQREREWSPEAETGHVQHFEAKPRAWGKHIAGTPLIAHNGKLYLEVKVETVLQTQYRHVETGKELFDVGPFLRKRSKSSGRQQVERAVVLRDYKLESIVELRLQGEIYSIVPADAARKAA